MVSLSPGSIRQDVADTQVIYSRGENIFSLGNYALQDAGSEPGHYVYTMDGSYGDYTVRVDLTGTKLRATCTCPYPRGGCKHVVAACLDIVHRNRRSKTPPEDMTDTDPYLTPEEIRELALKSREERARTEELELVRGETYKGTHVVRSGRRNEYTVTIYDPDERTGHCTCPDFATNHLDTCKHLLFVYNAFDEEDAFPEAAREEVFPFVHFTWSSRLQKPCCYYEQIDDPELRTTIEKLFSEKGVYTPASLKQLLTLYGTSEETDSLLFDATLLDRMADIEYQKEAAKLERSHRFDFSALKTDLYPYQQEGVKFAAFRKAAIIADEMGLGKTIQAIAVALIKRSVFGFEKILVVSPSSVKDQWRREIERFTDASCTVVAGGKRKRKQIYASDESVFKITNYEAVLRDVSSLKTWNPDFVILDEAQRIKNFETKTHRAVLSLPRDHCLVITGTPLENKLEDMYSIVQFCDPTLLTPLWAFAAGHLNLSKTKKGKVLGYRNLEAVHQKLQDLIIRRRKGDVFDSLPEELINTYYLDLSPQQEDYHQSYSASLLKYLKKKVLTPLDVKRMQMILLKMRMVCNSTYLVDKKTNVSPKLVELVSILKDLGVTENRKVVIFSEWTTMTYLIGKVLSDMGLDFVEFTGKIPVNKRQKLIDRFNSDPDCKVFLSSDAGGVGLNLQSADCVINFELPWNPARLRQRIGRVNRIGQTSRTINVVNLVSKNSIEERVLAAIDMKEELFDAVLQGNADEVDFGQERKNKFINQIRALVGEEEIPAPRPEPPEIEEQTPHFLNPEVLSEQEREVDVEAEEFGDAESEDEQGIAADGPEHVDENAAGASSSGQTGRAGGAPKPEELESVLNQGLAFLDSLSRMATGQPIVGNDSEGKSVEIDRETGEVVLRFKLPGT